MVTTRASIETDRGPRYIKQFVGHWGRHAGLVEETDGRTTMYFEKDGKFESCVIRFEASSQVLEITVTSPDASTVEAISSSLGEHLERFSASSDRLTASWSPDDS